MLKLGVRFNRLSITRKMLLLNGIYWIVFWSLFAWLSHPANTAYDIDEGVNFGKTLSGADATVRESFEIALLPQLPSMVLAGTAAGVVTSSLHLSPLGRYWGTSVSGSGLVLGMLISFAQWALIGWLIARFAQRRRMAPA